MALESVEHRRRVRKQTVTPQPSSTNTVGQLFDTLGALVGRELRTRYKGSLFGILWAILSPLGTVVVLQFVFGQVLSISTPHFGAFLYSGLLPWVWFSTAIESGATTLTKNRDLVRIPFFARPLLPAVVTCTNFLLYLFALPVLIALLVVDGVPITAAILALPAIWVVQTLLTLAFTIFIAASGVIIRDVQHLMGVVLLLWFYLTPVFYGLDQVPEKAAGWMALNPMAPIVTAHRDVTLYGRLPNWPQLGYWTIASVVLLAASLLVFRALEDSFVDET